jgi:hypothetical protein
MIIAPRVPLLFALAVLGLSPSATGAVVTRDVLLQRYVGYAVSSEQCGGRPMTMLEESRLARIINAESPTGPFMSVGEVAAGLSADRRIGKRDCNAVTVRDQVQQFAEEIMPQLRSPLAVP